MAITTTAVAASGGGGLPGGMTTNPNHLPVYDASNNIGLYDDATQLLANVASFWTEIGYVGAYVTGATDDTYKEICSLAGSGNLFHVIPPAHTNTSDTIGFRITVDGTVYEILKAQTWYLASHSSRRIVMGASVSGQLTSKYTTSTNYLNDFAGGGQSTSVFNKHNGSIKLVPPSEIMNNGMPCLRFEESLIVEAKVTDVLTTTYSDYCGATYILD